MSELRICRTKKKGFPTEEAAAAEVVRVANLHLADFAGRKLPENYRKCPYCGEFHLTRDEKWAKAKPKSRNKGKAWESR